MLLLELYMEKNIYHQKHGTKLKTGGARFIGDFVSNREIFTLWLELYILVAFLRPIIGMGYTIIVGALRK